MTSTPSTVDINVDGFGKRVLHLQSVINHYWNRFSHTYLNELREHHISCNRRTKTSETTRIKVDDLVIIKEDKMSPRSNWRTGRIEELVCGNDGRVRGAKLVTTSKTGKRVNISRPVQKLIPLEVLREDAEVKENYTLSKTTKDTDDLRRSTRNAALDGEVRRKYNEGLFD